MITNLFFEIFSLFSKHCFMKERQKNHTFRNSLDHCIKVRRIVSNAITCSLAGRSSILLRSCPVALPNLSNISWGLRSSVRSWFPKSAVNLKRSRAQWCKTPGSKWWQLVKVHQIHAEELKPTTKSRGNDFREKNERCGGEGEILKYDIMKSRLCLLQCEETCWKTTKQGSFTPKFTSWFKQIINQIFTKR